MKTRNLPNSDSKATEPNKRQRKIHDKAISDTYHVKERESPDFVQNKSLKKS